MIKKEEEEESAGKERKVEHSPQILASGGISSFVR